jgi:hypothetical protein
MVRFSIFINGSLYGFFDSSTRDPYPPMLFVVVMEALSRILSAIVDRGLLSGFSVGSKDNDMLHLSHFLFVGDMLIFCETNLDHLRNLGCLFLYFEAVS